MKHTTISELISIILIFCILFVSSCNKNEEKYIKNYGSFYTVEKAYKEKLINFDDLLSLAYYQNNGIGGNEKVMGNNFTPIPIEPNGLDDAIIHKIKATKATTKKEYDTLEIYDYFGTYNGAIAIKIKDSSSDIPTVVTNKIVEDILFVYPSYIMCIWKEA